MKVVEEIVLGALIQQSVIRRRCIGLTELKEALGGRLHRTSLLDILRRLEVQGKVQKSKFIFTHPAAKTRKRWIVNGYFPSILPVELNRGTN